MTNQQDRPKIAYLTLTDPNNRHSWSGTHYYIGRALEKYVGDVDLLGPIKPLFPTLWGMLLTGVSQKIFGKRYNYRHSKLMAKGYARLSQKKLSGKKYDLIVAPATTTFIPYLQTNVPIVYIGDATVENSFNYHHSLTKLFPSSKRETLEIETMAFQKASILIFSSQWACQSAIKDFNINPEKVFMIPFGANMDEVVSREKALEKKKSDKCTLLFIGVDWMDKGGELAHGAMLKLNEMGIETSIIVCGCTPPEKFNHPKMKVYPFLNKNDEEQRKTLQGVFLQADFLILPTQFDCTPIVFCEAFSFGLPVIARNTGGISSVVNDGITGCLIPPDAGADEYAKRIAEIFKDNALYNSMRENCRNAYDNTFNWTSWATKFKEVCSKVLNI